MAVHANLYTYTASGVWTKPPRLIAIDVILRGAGGAGTSSSGGGGGAAVERRRIPAPDLEDTIEFVVGAAGSGGQNGGDSSFGDLLTAAGGKGGANGRAGGFSYMPGGTGGLSGQPGETVTSGIVRLLAGGGGGAGANSTGGGSGLTPGAWSPQRLWQVSMSGGGGNSGGPGGFPAGGGGAGARGAAGLVTVIEYISGE